MDLSASATEICVAETDMLLQLSQGNAGCMDVFFGVVAGRANLRPWALICRAETT